MDLRRSLPVLLFASATLFLAACSTPPDRQLQSVTVTPDAAGPSATSIQFTATDLWNTSPTQTPATNASWGVCENNTPSTDVTVSRTGLATCGKGSSGKTYAIFVNVPPAGNAPVCNVIGACGGGCYLTASAQLTCP